MFGRFEVVEMTKVSGEEVEEATDEEDEDAEPGAKKGSGPRKKQTADSTK